VWEGFVAQPPKKRATRITLVQDGQEHVKPMGDVVVSIGKILTT